MRERRMHFDLGVAESNGCLDIARVECSQGAAMKLDVLGGHALSVIRDAALGPVMLAAWRS